MDTDIDRVHLLLRGDELKQAETWLADQTGRKPAPMAVVRRTMSPEPPRAAVPGDLRTQPYEDVIGRVEQALGVRLDLATLVRKRRTLGARSDRGTWVRIEGRPVERIITQGWAGLEAAAVLTGIAKPDWYQGVSWRDPAHALWWRADETELISTAPIKAGGTITVDPDLPASWWATLRASLSALAAQTTARVAKLHSSTASQDYLNSLVDKAASDTPAGVIDSTVTEWAPAHADLNSRSGQIVTLALCAELTSHPDYAGVLYEPARRETHRLLDTLTR